jgi:O-antigen ligase
MERKQNPKISWATWIPTFWMAKVASHDLAYWLGKGDAEPGSGSPYERYLLLLLFFVGLYIVYRRRSDWYKTLKGNIWVTILISYMSLSIFWTPLPLEIALKRLVKELIAVVMGLVVISEDSTWKAMESILRRYIYILIPLSLLLVLFFPDHGTQPFGNLTAWVGVTNHKNTLGRLCCISVFFLTWDLVRKGFKQSLSTGRYVIWPDVLVLAATVFLFKGPGPVKSLPVASIISSSIGVSVLFGYLYLKALRRYVRTGVLKLIVAGIIVVGTASVFAGGLVTGGEVTSSFGREETLTGRTKIWAVVLPYAMQEPIIGHGIDGFFAGPEYGQRFTGHSHNGYLEIICDYGFVGLFFVSMFLLSSCGKAQQLMQGDFAWGIFWISFLILSAIYDIAEPALKTFTSQHMAILLFLSFASSVTRNSFRSQKDDLSVE